MITPLTNEQQDLLKSLAIAIPHPEGAYYYIPNWFKRINESEFDIINHDDLPQSVKDYLPND